MIEMWARASSSNDVGVLIRLFGVVWRGGDETFRNEEESSFLNKRLFFFPTGLLVGRVKIFYRYYSSHLLQQEWWWWSLVLTMMIMMIITGNIYIIHPLFTCARRLWEAFKRCGSGLFFYCANNNTNKALFFLSGRNDCVPGRQRAETFGDQNVLGFRETQTRPVFEHLRHLIRDDFVV